MFELGGAWVCLFIWQTSGFALITLFWSLLWRMQRKTRLDSSHISFSIEQKQPSPWSPRWCLISLHLLSFELLSFPLMCPTKMPKIKLYTQTQGSGKGALSSSGTEQRFVRYEYPSQTSLCDHNLGWILVFSSCHLAEKWEFIRPRQAWSYVKASCQHKAKYFWDLRSFLHDLEEVALILLKWFLNSWGKEQIMKVFAWWYLSTIQFSKERLSSTYTLLKLFGSSGQIFFSKIFRHPKSEVRHWGSFEKSH